MSETNMNTNTNTETNTENKKSATQRLEDLENMMQQVGQALSALEPMARDLYNTKEALKLVANKLDSVLKAYNAGEPLTDEFINKHMTENNVTDLANKVKQMVDGGLLAATDTVTDNTFVVINEVDASGNVVNPRMQFLVSQLQNEEVRGKLNGAKTGSNLTVGNQGASINVLEAYAVVTPQTSTETPAADASVPTDAVADEASTTTATQTSATDATTTAFTDASTTTSSSETPSPAATAVSA